MRGEQRDVLKVPAIRAVQTVWNFLEALHGPGNCFVLDVAELLHLAGQCNAHDLL